MQLDHYLVEFDHFAVGLDSSQCLECRFHTLYNKVRPLAHIHVDTVTFREGQGELIDLVMIPLPAPTSE